MKKVSNNKAFVRLNLVRYKSHNTNSIPKQFIKNNARHHKIKKTAGGLPHRQLTDFDGESTTVANIFPARLRASCSAVPPTPASQYLSQNKTIQCLILVNTLVATQSSGSAWVK